MNCMLQSLATRRIKIYLAVPVKRKSRSSLESKCCMWGQASPYREENTKCVHSEYAFLFIAEKLHAQFLKRVITLSGLKHLLLMVEKDKNGGEKCNRDL